MFRSNPNYMKLRTNLRLCINRLKLLEKKKTELALKARREIADYISNGKEERARIRVEHIIREDLMVEAMEIIEMFCDLLLARFGLLEKMKELDPGLEECIATLLWAAPRLQTDVQEMKEVAHQLTIKYGKEYADMCRNNGFENVHEKVLIKMGTQPPPKILIENYMIEIAKAFNVPFEPDPTVMAGAEEEPVGNLIDIASDTSVNQDGKGAGPPGGGGVSPGGGGASGGGGGGGGGGGATNPDWLPPKPGFIPPDDIPMYRPADDPAPPYSPPRYSALGPAHMEPHPSASQPTAPPTSPPMAGYAPHSQSVPPAPGLMPDLPSPPRSAGNSIHHVPPPLPSHPPNAGSNTGLPNPVPPPASLPPPAGTAGPGSSQPPGDFPELPSLPDIPGLPSVPSGGSVASKPGEDSIDFDDLTKRFQELKKRK